MPNLFQKLIYNSSSAGPLLIAFAVVWYIQQQTLGVTIICISVAIVLMLSLGLSFNYGIKHLPPIKLNVSELSPHDESVMAFVISYLLPFASLVVKDFSFKISCGIALVVVALAPYINSAIANPLLVLKHYHFYSVSAEHGVSGYVLISKRNLRNAKDVTCVKRVFEFLILDMEV